VKSKLGIRRTAIAATFLAAFGASGLAFGIYEIEPNTTMATAQRLEMGDGGSVEVTAVLGNSVGGIVADVDFYVFEGNEGNVVTIDIDGGMKPGSSARGVDTYIAIFGQGGKKLAWNDDGGYPLDPGSNSPLDARITNFRLPATGAYTVGVSSYPRSFADGGVLTSNALGPNSNGTYTLLISGVVPLVLPISIDIKPGNNGESAPINPKSKGNIPVALLSSSAFNAAEVDQPSLRFGAEGDEISLLRCSKDYTDVNADDKLDLVCHFDTQTAGFEPGDIEGIVTGSLKDGRRFEGRGMLKVVPVKRQY
jgi:hypothetical protein